jgi:cytohesin
MQRSLRFRLSGSLGAFLILAVAFLAAGEIRAAAIHEAAKKGDTAAIGMLLDKDAALVNARDREHQGAYEVVGKDWTPLHWAAYSGQAGAATVLLDRGADPKARDAFGFTPLHYAATKELVDLLLDRGADINARSRSNGWTPLHRAAFTSNVEVARELVARGANVDARDRLGKRPLHYAAGWAQTPEMVRVLIAGKADVNARDHAGWTPLHNAAYAGKVEMARLLLDAGARAFAEDDFGMTPLAQARAAGREEVVKLLERSR